LKIDIPSITNTTLKFDTRTRNKVYISPEQIKVGQDLMFIAEHHNGKID